MAGKIRAEDLPEEMQESLGIKSNGRKAPRVSARLSVLGGVLVELKGLTVRDALWTLRQADYLIRWQRDNEKAIALRKKVRNGEEG